METTTVPTEAPKPTAAQETEQPKEKRKPMARTPRNTSEPASETKWPYAWKCEQSSNAALIPLEQIKCVPDRKIDELASKKLRNSMAGRMNNGLKPLMHPIVVRETDEGDFKFEVVDGKCRFTELQKLKVPGLNLGGEHPDMVFCDGDPEIVAFASNDVRNNLTLSEQVQKISSLIKEGKNCRQIADLTGWSPNEVARRARLQNLIPEWQEAQRNRIFAWMKLPHYEIIARFSQPLQKEIKTFCQRHYELANYSIKKFEAALDNEFLTVLSQLAWNKDLHETGCGECPACKDRKEGFLFSDMGEPKNWRCMNREYLNAKGREYVAELARENPEIILVASHAESLKIDDINDPLYGTNILPPSVWLECRKKESGEKAIRIDGNIGEEIYVKIEKPEPAAAPSDGSANSAPVGSTVQTAGKTGAESTQKSTANNASGRPKTMAERRQELEKRRRRYAIELLKTHLKKEECKVPERDAIFTLVACKGANSAFGYHFRDDKARKTELSDCILSFEKAFKLPELDRLVWNRVVLNIISELDYGQNGGSNKPRWKEAEIIAKLVEFDLENAYREAVKAKPEPSIWKEYEALEKAAQEEAEKKKEQVRTPAAA